jgi:hypothetical protein
MFCRKPKSALLIVCLAACGAACSSGKGPDSEAETTARAQQVGTIVSGELREASGIALSNYRNDQFWVLNDGGWPAAVHAAGADGADLGATLTDLENIDWEDLASFELNGARYLLIADVGDNGGARDEVALHFVPEPNPPGIATATASRTIRFRYPDGPRDAESIAVDAREGAAYILSKRTVPAELYRVPFAYAGTSSDPVIAEYLGPITSLPQPSQEDLQQAVARKDWGWQPTAMDFAADGKSAALLTYRAVYIYSRDKNQSWYDALQTPPVEQSLGLYFGAESIAFGKEAVFVTFEGPHPAILRFPLPETD